MVSLFICSKADDEMFSRRMRLDSFYFNLELFV